MIKAFTKRTFTNAAEFNNYLRVEKLKHSAQALLTADPAKRAEHERRAAAMDKTLHIFDNNFVRR